jgi:hypothetical protein
LIRGTPYYFVVTAENSLGESSDSSEVTATPDPPNPTFSQADLTGIWNVRVLQSGTNNGWYDVTESVNDSGIVSIINNGGSLTPPTVPGLSITSGTGATAGVVTETGVGSNTTFHGKMSTSKNLIVGTSTVAGGNVALHVFVKRVPGVVYGNADLTNTTFIYNKVYSGAFLYWEKATGTIDVSQMMHLTSAEDSSGVLGPQPNYTTISMDITGAVTLGLEPSFRGVMSPDKKLIIGASSDPPYSIHIYQMRGQTTYTQADLAGTSIAFTFHSDSTPSWDYATWLTDVTGAVTGSNWMGSDTGTTPLLNTWSLTLDLLGEVTTSGDLVSDGGWMSFGKDLVVIVGDSPPPVGSYMMIKVQ